MTWLSTSSLHPMITLDGNTIIYQEYEDLRDFKNIWRAQESFSSEGKEIAKLKLHEKANENIVEN